MRFFLLLGAGALVACGGETSDVKDASSDVSLDLDIVLDVKVKDSPSDVNVSPDADAGPLPPVGGKPPPPPDGGAPTTNVLTFAMQTIYLGEAPRNGGAPSTTAWQSYGYDVDGLVTTKSSTNVCTLQTGAPLTNQVDGVNGIDNSWGSTLLRIMQTVTSSPTPSVAASTLIASGSWTMQVQVTGLSDDPQQNAVGLTSQIMMSSTYPNGTPAFDSTTDWPVLSTSVKDGKTIASGSTVQFSTSYVSGGTFVTGVASSPFTLQFSTGGVTLPITIHDAVITFDHVAHASAANGTISGVLDTQEFINALQVVAGQISTSLCGSAFASIADQIKQAQDIMNDGTNAPSVACNAISIGLGFDATLVHDPTSVAQASPPPPDPCGD